MGGQRWALTAAPRDSRRLSGLPERRGGAGRLPALPGGPGGGPGGSRLAARPLCIAHGPSPPGGHVAALAGSAEAAGGSAAQTPHRDGRGRGQTGGARGRGRRGQRGAGAGSP